MASTPSASALSAVLRCQGNILARNQASKKRPAASVYALGKARASPDRPYMRALLGFIFHGESLEIPGAVAIGWVGVQNIRRMNLSLGLGKIEE